MMRAQFLSLCLLLRARTASQAEGVPWVAHILRIVEAIKLSLKV